MKISAIVEDKTIVKDGLLEVIDDDTFWSTYNAVHAFQIDTDAKSVTENKDGTQTTTTQSIINALSDKFDSTKTAREAAEKTAQDNYTNSWDRVRQERDAVLSWTDKYLLSDYPITDENKTKIETYRKSLRDLPGTYSSEEPKNIVFANNGNVSVSGSVVITKPSL